MFTVAAIIVSKDKKQVSQVSGYKMGSDDVTIKTAFAQELFFKYPDFTCESMTATEVKKEDMLYVLGILENPISGKILS